MDSALWSGLVRGFVFLAAIGCLSWVEPATQSPITESGEKIALSVLYAGNLKSDRASDFEQLLKSAFTTVGIADYQKFTPADADDFDVVIFDWTTTYPRDENGKINWKSKTGFSSPRPPRLGRTFDRPAVLIGAAGGSISNGMNIALNWK